MRLYFKNYQENLFIPAKSPLEASVWQALDIFDNLPENDDSFLCLVNIKDEPLRFSKYNKFVWLIEMPKPHLGGSYQGYFTKNRCMSIIKNVFKNTEFKDIQGLNFEKYL